ncbi:MAG: hypothetical protein R3D58_09855 [Saprospiraceae bacterium]|nr:hypothetical protein [Lewinellaceae bacterium]
MEPIPEQDRAAHLQELASKSWNLELIISGAAIFLVSYLPGLVDQLLGYYLENLADSSNLSKSTLPVLVFSFFKVIAWVLIGTFVVHFVLRAFWVGLVGLHAVYPEGIRYENLPWQTDLSKKITQQNFGQLTDYILRLDRLSNQIFSFAFLIALMGIGISLIYTVLFVGTNPNAFPDWMGNHKIRSLVFLGLVLAVALMPAVAQLLSRRENLLRIPWVKNFVAKTIKYAPGLILPLVYRPLTYINLIYSSNVSRKRLFSTLALATTLVMGAVLWVFANKLMELRGRDLFVRQAYFGENNTTYKLYPAHYDQLRQPNNLMPALTIQSDVVEGPVLRLFVAYRKWLDGPLEKHCGQLQLPKDLGKNAQRIMKDSFNMACLSGFFQLSVNDSVFTQPDWAFYTHPETGSHGLLGYVPTTGFQTGKNILSIRIPSTAKPDSLVVYGQLPFWFYR